MYNYQDIFDGKNKILFVTAHPDDAIVFFGALIYKLRQDNKEVYVLNVTNGARGSRENVISEEELANKRLKEEVEALKVLGVDESNYSSLNYKDGEVESDMKLIGEIARMIRKFKADIVCTHEPSLLYSPTYSKTGFFVQHRDHRKIGEAVIDAVYPFSRDRSFFPEHLREGIEPHSVYDILLTDEKDCNFDFDYTANLEIKKESLRKHESQFSEEVVNDLVFEFEGKYLETFNYLKLLW